MSDNKQLTEPLNRQDVNSNFNSEYDNNQQTDNLSIPLTSDNITKNQKKEEKINSYENQLNDEVRNSTRNKNEQFRERQQSIDKILKESEDDKGQDQQALKNVPSYQFDSLTNLNVLGYAVGHFLNDLCAAIWFNYLLFYLISIKQLGTIAPYSMLAGQIADAIATPLVGFLSDKTHSRFGKRTPWYFIGVIVVILTFLPIFLPILPSDAANLTKIIYFVTFPALFNIGWASVQISHMSLVPSLTCSRKRRDLLNGKRNTFTFIANLVVLLLALLLFQFESTEDSFTYLAMGCTGIGFLMCVFFLSQIKEKKMVKDCSEFVKKLKQIVKEDQQQENSHSQKPNQAHHISPENFRISKTQADLIVEAHIPKDDEEFSDDETKQVFHSIVHQSAKGSFSHKVESFVKNRMTLGEIQTPWQQWFKEKLFYQCGVIYMGARLYCNVIATMMNFYLVYVLEFATEDQLSSKTPIQVALIPLILYISSVGFSSMIEKMFNWFGRKKTFSIGGVMMLISSVALAFLEPSSKNVIYLIAFLIGGAQALVLNTGITLISEVIGVRGSSGAFVFGIYSFTDKLSSGIALFLISMLPGFKSPGFTRWVTVLIPGISCFLAWIFVILQETKEYKQEEPKNNRLHKDSIKSQLEDELAV